MDSVSDSSKMVFHMRNDAHFIVVQSLTERGIWRRTDSGSMVCASSVRSATSVGHRIRSSKLPRPCFESLTISMKRMHCVYLTSFKRMSGYHSWISCESRTLQKKATRKPVGCSSTAIMLFGTCRRTSFAIKILSEGF